MHINTIVYTWHAVITVIRSLCCEELFKAIKAVIHELLKVHQRLVRVQATKCANACQLIGKGVLKRRERDCQPKELLHHRSISSMIYPILVTITQFVFIFLVNNGLL